MTKDSEDQLAKEADASLAVDLPPGRVLGLDAGERRIGVAISDPEQRLAVPLPTIDRKSTDELTALSRLVREEELAAVVVGLPLSLSGERGPQAEKAEELALRVRKACNLPVFLWDERLSSREAEHY